MPHRLMSWLVTVLLAGAVFAQGILVVQVSDTAKRPRPLQGIVIGTGVDGSMERTDSHGKARILLAEGTRRSAARKAWRATAPTWG